MKSARNKTNTALPTKLCCLALLCVFVATGCLRLEESDFDSTNTTGLLWTLLFTRSSFALGQTNTTSVQGVSRGMQSPYKLSIAGDRLFLMDPANRRALIYNTLPNTADHVAPDIAIGQPDLHTTLVAASTYPFNSVYINRGRGIYSDGTRVYAVDNQAHRVLIWNSIPTSNLQAANVVLGQFDFSSSTSGTSANSLNSPEGVAVCGTQLFIADTSNHRVLIWNTIPIFSGQNADVVVGQTNFTNNTSGNMAQQMSSPRGVYCDGTKLYVADSGNNRVLIFNTVPTAPNALADVVVGQTNFGLNASGNAANQMQTPEDVHVNGNMMYVADTANHRVLYFTSIPTSNNAFANGVIGQPSFGVGTSNNPDSRSGLVEPRGVASNGSYVFIADTSNNRVVVHSNPQPANGTTHDLVQGQPNLNTKTANTTAPTATIYRGSGGTAVIGNRFYTAAADDNRVVGYNSIPTTSGVAADFVLGQPDLTSSSSGTSQSTFHGPGSLCSNGSWTYVVDTQNNRVLGFNGTPTATGTVPDIVICQNDFTGNMQNKGTAVAADTLANPTTVHCGTDRLVVADASNSRVLVYEPAPTTTNPSASIVLGQPNMTTAIAGTNQSTFNGPQGAIVDENGRLIVADTQNQRVLIYNSVPTSNGANADLVLGQADFSGMSANAGSATPIAQGLNFPNSILVQNGNLLVSDLFNNRVLIWTTFPTTTNQAPDRVFGQSSFTESRPNLGGVSATTLNAPFALLYHNGFVYMTDALNQRVLGVLAGDMGLSGF